MGLRGCLEGPQPLRPDLPGARDERHRGGPERGPGPAPRELRGCGGLGVLWVVHVPVKGIQGASVFGVYQGPAGGVYRDCGHHLRTSPQPLARLAPAEEDGECDQVHGPGHCGCAADDAVCLPLPLPNACRSRCGDVDLRFPFQELPPRGVHLHEPLPLRVRDREADTVAQEVPHGDHEARQRLARPPHRLPRELRDREVLHGRRVRAPGVPQSGAEVPEVLDGDAGIAVAAEHLTASCRELRHGGRHDHRHGARPPGPWQLG
mmetsp:Transcript_111008/g.358347  ORF Transcript_111008/g.358347 Transcript_111008/m.358347 type:complete len:263 (+) Transcript_111008:775-1563(+)